MMIISFAHTTPALLAGRKTVTRRQWDDRYAARFREGDLVAAYDRSPRIGGRQVAVIRLTQAPRREPLTEMPDADWEGEGFAYLYEHPGQLPKTLWGAPCRRESFSRESFSLHQRRADWMWTVRFELLGLTPAGAKMLAEIEGV